MKDQQHQDHYQIASDWHYQRYQNQRVWLSRALLGCLLLSIMLVLSLMSNLFLFPLKQKVPFLYTVNHKTGELTQIGEFKPETFKEDWLMTRFLLIRYVIHRESYDANHLDRPYQIAWSMSDSQIAQEYANAVKTDNPASPYAVYGQNKILDVHVLSINTLNENTAEVRFEQTLNDRHSGTQQTVQKVAIVKWRYTTPI